MMRRIIWLSTVFSVVIIALALMALRPDAAKAQTMAESATSTYIASWDSPVIGNTAEGTITVAFTAGSATTTNVTFTIREHTGIKEYSGTKTYILRGDYNSSTKQWKTSWVTGGVAVHGFGSYLGGFNITVSSSDWPKTYTFGPIFVDNSTYGVNKYYGIAISTPTPQVGTYVRGRITLGAEVTLASASTTFFIGTDITSPLSSFPASLFDSPYHWTADWDTTLFKNGTYFIWAKGVAGTRERPTATTPSYILYVDNPPTAPKQTIPASMVIDSTTATAFKAETETAAAPSIDVDKGLVVNVAAACVAGDLLKTPSSAAVYYCGADGKRYVFANDKVYRTWYPVDPTVKTISVEALASIPLGGNVTYRPGVKMIKIVSDPKTYAVSRGGKLRWVTSEAVASALYGPDWNQKIDDVSDAFFVNYKMGEPITSAP